MNSKLFFIACILVSGCGKKGDAEFKGPDVTKCTLTENIVRCPDGTIYELPPIPEDTTDPITVIVEVIVEVVDNVVVIIEEEVEYQCEKDNRNGRKCKKIKKN